MRFSHHSGQVGNSLASKPSRLRDSVMIKGTTAERILKARATLGEGACWDHQRQRLLWLDILNCEVHTFDPATGTDTFHKAPYHVTLVHPTTRGDLILGTKMGIARMDPENGAFTPLCDPEADLPGNRFNDGKPDPRGRLFAGSLAYDGSDKKANLWRIETDLSYTKVIDHAGNSNGLGWSPDEKTFYWTDTKTSSVYAFDYDADSGEISNQRVAVEVDRSLGRPDGMTVDAEGCLWTALWNGYGLARWDPRTGKLMEKISCPCPNVTCPTFGGPNLDILYFTTAIKGRDEAEPAPEEESGNLFAAKPGVKGMPGYRFAG